MQGMGISCKLCCLLQHKDRKSFSQFLHRALIILRNVWFNYIYIKASNISQELPRVTILLWEMATNNLNKRVWPLKELDLHFKDHDTMKHILSYDRSYCLIWSKGPRYIFLVGQFGSGAQLQCISEQTTQHRLLENFINSNAVLELSLSISHWFVAGSSGLQVELYYCGGNHIRTACIAGRATQREDGDCEPWEVVLLTF